MDEIGKYFEKRDKAASFFNVEIFNVRSDDPEKPLRAWDHLDHHVLVDFFIEDKLVHKLILAG